MFLWKSQDYLSTLKNFILKDRPLVKINCPSGCRCVQEVFECNKKEKLKVSKTSFSTYRLIELEFS